MLGGGGFCCFVFMSVLFWGGGGGGGEGEGRRGGEKGRGLCQHELDPNCMLSGTIAFNINN